MTTNLPPRADAVYSTWWSLASTAADAGWDSDKFTFTPADLSAAASDLAGTLGAQYAHFDPVGLSQLFSRARQISAASRAVTFADDTARVDIATMTALAPWAAAEQVRAAEPKWLARTDVTYTDTEGNIHTDTLTASFTGQLPFTAGNLRAQLALKLQDLLDRNEHGNYPLESVLTSIDRITLLEI